MKSVITFFIFFFVGLMNFIMAESQVYFNILDVGSSAKMVRQGNIYGFSNKADSVFENPAALYRIGSFSSSFFRTTFMGDLTYINGSVAVRGMGGVFGLGYMRVATDSIPKSICTLSNVSVLSSDTNKIEEINFPCLGFDAAKSQYFVHSERIQQQGNFLYTDSVYRASYTFSYNRFIHVGFASSFFSKNFDTVSASGYNMDFGLIAASTRFHFSFLIRNFLASNDVVYKDTDDLVFYSIIRSNSSTLSFQELDTNSSDGLQEKLPLETVYSIKYNRRNYSLMGQMQMITNPRKVKQSLSFNFNPRFLDFFSASVGMQKYPLDIVENSQLVTKDKMSLTFGLGLELIGIHFDFAYEESDYDLNKNKFYFSLGYSY